MDSDFIKICDVIEDENTGGAVVVLEVTQEALYAVFSKWFTEAIVSHANEVLSTLGTSAVPSQEGPTPDTNQSQEETTRSGDMGDPVDWGQSFKYPHER